MEPIIIDKQIPLFTRISPGKVGSVGDTLMNTRLRQNKPSDEMRFSNETKGKKEQRFGSFIQDGTKPSLHRPKSKPPKVVFGGMKKPVEKRMVGLSIKDVSPRNVYSTPVEDDVERGPWKYMTNHSFGVKPKGYSTSIFKLKQSIPQTIPMNSLPRLLDPVTFHQKYPIYDSKPTPLPKENT